MSNSELLTVQQFADAAGISKQAVYKAINNQLKPFVQLVNGKKMLRREALQEVYGISIDQPLNNRINPLNLTLQMLQQQLEEKDRQLAAKDEQIKTLNEELAKEREHSRGTADKLATLADQAQALHAGTVQQQLQTPAAPEVIIEDPDVEEARPAKKPGLFTRMFWKKE